MSNKFAVFLSKIPNWAYNISFIASNLLVIVYVLYKDLPIILSLSSKAYPLFSMIVKILILGAVLGELLTVLIGLVLKFVKKL